MCFMLVPRKPPVCKSVAGKIKNFIRLALIYCSFLFSIFSDVIALILSPIEFIHLYKEKSPRKVVTLKKNECVKN